MVHSAKLPSHIFRAKFSSGIPFFSIRICIFLVCLSANAQHPVIDSLKQELWQKKEDTSKIEIMLKLVEKYDFYDLDSAVAYSQQALNMSDKANYLLGQSRAYSSLFMGYNILGDYEKSLQVMLSAKQPTDINALAEEYLRLSLHGTKATDKSFDCNIKRDLDPEIGKIEIIPQDMGRVFLNIYNNAFYSMNEKTQTLKGKKEFAPLITVSTRRINSPSGAGGVEMRILLSVYPVRKFSI